MDQISAMLRKQIVNNIIERMNMRVENVCKSFKPYSHPSHCTQTPISFA